MVAAVLILIMFFWGGSFIAIKVGLRYMTPVDLVLARFIPSAVLLMLLALYHQRAASRRGFKIFRLSRKEKLALVIVSLAAVPGYHFCLNTGETMIPAGWASLVIALNPACISVFAAIILNERVGASRWIGIAIAFSGLVFITLTNEIVSDDGIPIPIKTRLLGVVITFGAVLCWGGFTVISKRLISRHQPIVVLAWSISLGTLWLIPFIGRSFYNSLVNGPVEMWLSIFFLSVGCTVIAFVLWFWVLNQWDASRAGAFIHLVPVFALILSHFVLGERLDLSIILGVVMVLGGVLLAGFERRHKPNHSGT